MSSSIFSSENLRAYGHLDGAQRRFHLFLVAVGVAVLLLGHSLTNSVEKALWPYGRTAPLVQARATLSETTKVVFTGSSHLRAGIRPEVFTFEATSIAGPGWDYSTIEAAVRNNLERMPNLELVIIELDVTPLRLNTSVVASGQCQMLRVWGIGRQEVPCENRKLGEPRPRYSMDSFLRVSASALRPSG